MAHAPLRRQVMQRYEDDFRGLVDSQLARDALIYSLTDGLKSSLSCENQHCV
jgi:hypothetical protein